MKCYIVGIAGGSCSGKTTLADSIKSCFGVKVGVIQHDNYYLSRTQVPEEKRKNINFDHPSALETELLIKHIKEIRNGNTIISPLYDFKKHDRKQETVEISPLPVIIVEGLLIFENEELRNLFDYKVFVDVDSKTRLSRRIIRDTKTRGRKPEDIIKQYRTTVEPMHELYVEKFKNCADLIVTDKDFSEKEKVILSYLEKIVKSDISQTGGRKIET